MLPQAFCEKMSALLGEEYEEFLSALDRPRAVGLRLNPLKSCLTPCSDAQGGDPTQQSASAFQYPGLKSYDDLLQRLSAFNLSPVPWEPTGYCYDPAARPGLHPFHDAGVYYLQEPSAMAPAVLLDPRPGERVLDLCAAPGGKTTQIAGRMGGRGILVCSEINPARAKILSSNVERMGVANALVLNEHPARLAERFAGWFDRILVDAPCSGEGMFRKHEAAFTDWSQDTVTMCARRQAEILDSAAAMLRPGGRLVYSTCTFSPEENEGGIAAFLERHPEFSPAAVTAPWFAPGRPEWTEAKNPDLVRCFRLWPHRLRGEGHFAAVLEKQGGERGEVPMLRAERLPAAVQDLLTELCVPLPEGRPVSFGDTWYLAPPECPELRGLRVLRPGLELAEVRRDRAVPAHALALWSRTAPGVLDLSADGEEILRYLQGQTLPCSGAGWTLVRADGFSVGWAKTSGGVAKNHYPKGLRRS